MAQGPPSHARVRLGRRLRQAREELGYTQAQVAEQIGRAQNWIMRLESAQMVRVKMGDLNLLLDTLGITGGDAEEQRRRAREKYDGGGMYLERRENIHWWHHMQEVEAEARIIKAAHLQAMDGLLQCESYMRRQFELGGGVNVERRVQSRLARQDSVLGQNRPPDCTFVLDEACLYTDMGDPDMMRTQLEHLLRLSEKPYITLLVKRFGAQIQAATYGFTLLQFGSYTMRDFAVVEYEVGAATIDDDDALHTIQDRWERIRSAAESEYDTRRVIRRVLDEYTTRTKGQ